MKKISLASAAIPLLFAACTTAPQKPAQWNVKATTESDKKIWVSKSDGSRQCDSKAQALTPKAATDSLQAAGIAVFQAKAGNDGLMHAQKCGSPTGSTVDLEISRIDLRKALSLGFVTKSL